MSKTGALNALINEYGFINFLIKNGDINNNTTMEEYNSLLKEMMVNFKKDLNIQGDLFYKGEKIIL